MRKYVSTKYTRYIIPGIFALILMLMAGCEIPQGPMERFPTPRPSPTPPKEAVKKKVPDMPLAVFQGQQETVRFMDREELPNSSTVFEMQTGNGILCISYDIAYYAGFAIDIEPQSLQQYDTLYFRLRNPDGIRPSMVFQVTDTDGLRQRMRITPYIEEGETGWQEIRLPLSRLDQFGGAGMQSVRQVAFVFHKGNGELCMDDIMLQKTGIKAKTNRPPYPEHTGYRLPHGTAAWCYGDMQPVIRTVQRYNANVPANRRIRYLFPYSGSVSFHGPGDYSLAWHPSNAIVLAQALTNVHILPMIDGLSNTADLIDDPTWATIGQHLADLVHTNELFYGLQLDIEPFDTIMYDLFAQVKAHTDKPLTIAAGLWDTDTFKYTDMVVLMAYDWALNVPDYREKTRGMIQRFLQDAETGGGHAMIGLPAIATHHEYESISDTPEGPGRSTGFLMEDYVREAMQITADIDPPPEVFRGYCLWAFHPDGGLHGPRDTKWYFPSHIKPEVWDILSTAE